MTCDKGFLFTAEYDAENRLTSLEYTDGANVAHRTEYGYFFTDFLARVRKSENDQLVSETQFVRDGLLAIQDRDGNNNVVSEYLWGLDIGGGIGGLLNMRQGGQDYRYLYDGRGNVGAVIGADQVIAAAYRYDAFGNVIGRSGNLGQPFGFSTKRYDAQTGLSYYGYRYYSPEIGKWLTRDPLGEAGGVNLYGFVQNNPVNFMDPLGLHGDHTNIFDFIREHNTGVKGLSPERLAEIRRQEEISRKRQDEYRAHLKHNLEMAWDWYTPDQEAMGELYMPYLRSNLENLGQGLTDMEVRFPFPPGHPVVSWYQYQYWKGSNPGGSYYDFWYESVFGHESSSNQVCP